MPFLYDIPYLAYAFICPVALSYIYLLIDRWRITRRGKVLLAVFSALLAPGLLVLLSGRGIPIGIFLVLPWIVLFPILWWASRTRGAPLLFVVLSAVLFTNLAHTVADKLAQNRTFPAILFRLILDGVLLYVCFRFYRPVFRTVLQATQKGWLLLCLIPLALLGAYLALLSFPNYFYRSLLPQVQFFVIALLLIALVIYAVIFSFFQKLQLWHEYEVGTSLLDAQLEDLNRRLQQHQAASERSRILRHDLRHYLPLFSERLQAGDTAGARDILDAMRALTAGDHGEGGASS